MTLHDLVADKLIRADPATRETLLRILLDLASRVVGSLQPGSR
jgi:hypothetical protein